MGRRQAVRGATVADGVTLPYRDAGAAHGPAVALLHGLGDSLRAYDPVVEHLPDSIRVLVPSLRGHGDADRPEAGYAHDDHVRDVAALLDAAGVRRAVIGGHSSGSQIALRFALTHPERAQGLVLIGAPDPSPDPQAAAPMTAQIAALTDPVDEGWLRGFADTTVGAALPETFMAAMLEDARKVPARVYQAMWPSIRDFDVADRLGDIAAPTLLVWGDRDRVPVATRQAQERLLAGLRDARLLVYEGAGHSPHWEQPQRFAADVAAFVEQVVSLA